jgi:hypothetical protein
VSESAGKLADVGRRMYWAGPEACRAMVSSILPQLDPESVVEIHLSRDGHVEERTAGGTVRRHSPPGCDCELCRG